MFKNFFNSKNGVFIIAEIGGNHEGNFEYAKNLTKLAAESGADAIKFQIYTGNTLVNHKYDPKRVEHFKKFQLKQNEYLELAKLCKKLGVSFMASVWDPNAFKYIDKYIPIYKIGSGDLTNYSLIKKILSTSKPIIISTGLANINEIEELMDFIKRNDDNYIKDNKIALLQCSSMYPIKHSEANLNVIHTYKDKFRVPVGYSDHTEGKLAIEVAMIMGADIIEIHFTDDRSNKKFRDHKVSLTKDEIIEFRKYIKKVKALKGSYNKKPTKSEIENNHHNSFRRSVYFNKNLPKGHIIRKSDLITLRPVRGIKANNFYKLIGLKLKRSVKKNQSLQKNYFDKVKKW